MVTNTQFELAPQLPYIKLNKNEKLLNVFNRSFHKTTGLSTIISLPKNKPILWKGTSIASVILIHGHLSHKNAIYQPMLADVLSTMGFLVLRFDFRGQGDSEDNFDIQRGRLLEQDLEDLATVVDLLEAPQFIKLVGENTMSNEVVPLSLTVMVAHSRGALVMYEYMLSRQQDSCPCALLINCSGRFHGQGYYDKLNKTSPNWTKDGGFKAKTLRHGQIIDLWIPRDEIYRTAVSEGTRFSKLKSKAVHLLYYGDCDTVVPLTDAYHYKRLFEDNAILKVIRGADHNFYGLKNGDDSDGSNDDNANVRGLPLKRGRVNYSFELVADIVIFFSILKELASS